VSPSLRWLTAPPAMHQRADHLTPGFNTSLTRIPFLFNVCIIYRDHGLIRKKTFIYSALPALLIRAYLRLSLVQNHPPYAISPCRQLDDLGRKDHHSQAPDYPRLRYFPFRAMHPPVQSIVSRGVTLLSRPYSPHRIPHCGLQ
jgi:hypothetical protein